MIRAPHSPAARRVLGAAAAIALTVTLSGCGVLGSVFGQGNVFTIKVGDCFNEGTYTDGEISDVDIVDCSQLHELEATKSVILTDASYPGDAAIQARGDSECLAAFEEYTGQSYDTFTDWDYTFYWPTTGSWEGGDREILCLVGNIDGPVTGSVKNFAG
ncbi:MAG TPA: septum formation family protein [Terrimesophilobacter sp.]|nr:septum formation family protein [Terrimesophilobacter sp.]HRP99213.1 septum formation family protein [Terrimesophilobacter sp.]